MPAVDDLNCILDETITAAEVPELDPVDSLNALDALLGLAAFPAEQVLAMSLSRTGLDLDQLWERKRQVIEQAPGLSVWRGGETFTFEQVMRQIKAKYVVRLTATPTRKDGHHPIIYMQCGPVRFSMSARTMTESTPFEHQVIPRRTDFRLPSDPAQVAIQEIYAALVADTARNEMIARDVIACAYRKSHLGRRRSSHTCCKSDVRASLATIEKH